MPSSTRQKMTINNNTIYSAAFSKSSSLRLKNAYPNSPMNTSDADKQINDAERREFFAVECQSGHFPMISDFDGSYNYGVETDSGVSPRQDGAATAPNEARPGNDGSTIAAAGRGPNVATLPADFAGGQVPPTHKNIDAGSLPGSAPFAGTGGGYDGQAHDSTSRLAKPTVEDDLTKGESGALGDPVGARIVELPNPAPGQPDGAGDGS